MALVNRIQSLWNPAGKPLVVDLENDYFLVRFKNEEDYSRVLMGGPWMIYGSYLIVQPWGRLFSTLEDHPSQIIAWVRLPGLHYRYYTRSLFRILTGVIGKVVRVDYNTSDGKRGKFARIAVIIDLTKPLVAGIKLDGHLQRTEYEGLPTICLNSGKYGHPKEVCAGVVEDNPFGPWMQATRRGRKMNLNRKDETTSKENSGIEGVSSKSRFDVLSNDANLENEVKSSIHPNNQGILGAKL
ncbi:uncharacterized protein LOC120190550 [Hibiscus syriacus]|uniref:uncharacterized protein LOC120190550 n=1 Tax=Hibiscus syriacus TaxID=106335 RepID=UPI001922DA41|nr:uncharacterized protein LOC120190550 [Hibiscus syriacus]